MTKICKAFPRERNPQIYKHLPKEFIIVYALSVCIDVYIYTYNQECIYASKYGRLSKAVCWGALYHAYNMVLEQAWTVLFYGNRNQMCGCGKVRWAGRVLETALENFPEIVWHLYLHGNWKHKCTVLFNSLMDWGYTLDLGSLFCGYM